MVLPNVREHVIFTDPTKEPVRVLSGDVCGKHLQLVDDGNTKRFYGSRSDYRIIKGIDLATLALGTALSGTIAAFAVRHGLETLLAFNTSLAESSDHLMLALIYSGGAYVAASITKGCTGTRYGGLCRTAPSPAITVQDHNAFLPDANP